MKSRSYLEAVVDGLRSSPMMARHGFDAASINWWKKGANRHDLMVVTKSNWTIASPEGVIEGYTGVNVHLETETPGILQIHCELCPRQGSEAKADQVRIASLLKLKGRVTDAIRKQIEPRGLRRLGATLDRIKENGADPKSLKVMGFRTGLPEGHSPQQFVTAIEELVDVMVPMIDGLLVEVAGDPTSRVCRECSAQNNADARFCRRCGQPLEDDTRLQDSSSAPGSAIKPTKRGIRAIVALLALIALVGVLFVLVVDH